MKKILIVFLMVGLSILIYTNVSRTENVAFFSDRSGFELEYKNTDVEKTHEVVMESDDYFQVSVEKEKGQINIIIKDSNGNCVYSGTDIPTSEFNVQISKADTYIVETYGHNVSGEIRIFGKKSH